LCIALATATAVTELAIKQFLAIPQAGKVVVGPCMMAMPLFLFDRDVGRRSRTHGAVTICEQLSIPAVAIGLVLPFFSECPAA
jgi:hypothetical protein